MHPLLADDYLDFPRMRALVQDVATNRTGAVFLPVPGFQDRWDVVSYDHPLPGLAPFELPKDQKLKSVDVRCSLDFAGDQRTIRVDLAH